MANPPFMTPKGGIRPHKKFAMHANRSEVLFVDYIMEHINPTTGRAAVIVPEGIIFQSASAYKALRKLLVGKNFLYGVVSLPAGLFQPYSGVKTSILLLDKTLAKKTDKILFVKIGNDGYSLGAQRKELTTSDLPDATNFIKQYITAIRNNDFSQIDSEHLRLDSITVEKSRIAENDDFNLSIDRYRVENFRQQVKHEWAMLQELCEMQTGSRDKGGALDEGIPSIGGEQISSDGTIKFEKMKYISQDHFNSLKKGVLNKNDVLLVKDGATTGKVGFYKGDYNFAAINEHVYLLRTNERINSFLFYHLLRSDDFQNRLKKFIKGIIGGISSEISQIEIPVPSIVEQQEIVPKIEQYEKIIAGAKQVVENYKPQIDIKPKWEMVELGKVCETEYGYTDTAKDIGDARYIRITDINSDGKLKENDAKFINLTSEAKEYILNTNDIVVARTGATFGKTLIYEGSETAVFASYLIRLKFDLSKVNPKYYWCFAQSDDYWRQANILVSGGGQPQFNANAIIKIKFPLPPLSEQNTIVAKIEKEQQLVNASKELVKIFEQKIKDEINKLWEE
jgi:type I restriction enzyme M protein